MSKSNKDDGYIIHCPICGGRLCDSKSNEKVVVNKDNIFNNGIILKCYKCRNKINIMMQ